MDYELYEIKRYEVDDQIGTAPFGDYWQEKST